MFIVETRKADYGEQYANSTNQMECEVRCRAEANASGCREANEDEEPNGSPTSCRKFSGLSRMKLRRSDNSSKHQQCGSQLHQIEMFFTCPIDCTVRVTMPNGQESNPLAVDKDHEGFFSPTQAGCGHGQWLIEVFNLKMELQHTEELDLQGVGSLHFEIGADYDMFIVSKDWLRLPPASLCCY